MGPHYSSHKADGDKLIVYLNNSDGLHYAEGITNAPYAEVAGDDGKWKEARVTIGQDGSLIFSSPDVPSPINARYCYSNWHIGTIYNGADLPLFPFATKR